MRKIYKLLLMLVLGILAFTDSSFGQNEYYLDFDGTNDYVKYLDDATLGLMDGATDYTIEAWILPEDGIVANYDRVLQRYYSFSIQMYDGNGDGNLEDWYFYTYDGANHYFNTEGDATLTLDAWNHIAIINNSSDGTLKLYVNGVDVTASGGYSNLDLRPSQTNDNLYVGQKGNGNSYFGGYIDEVRLKNTAEDIGDLNYSKYGNQYASDANTAALFHFNEGFGTNAINSASSIKATLNNGPTWRTWRYETDHHLPLACEWIYAVNQLWETDGNWGGGLPTSSNDVIIPGNSSLFPDIRSAVSARCNNMTIESNITVFVDQGGDLIASNDVNLYGGLEINGDVTVNGSLYAHQGYNNIIIHSNSLSEGSLIHYNTGVGAKVERYITNYTTADDGWHLISSPVDNMAIAGSNFEPVSGTDDLFYWDEDVSDSGLWINYHADGGGFGFTNFTNGQGYLCAYNALNETKEFQGNLNVDDVSSPSNMSNALKAWQLVGNPFSSAIDWAAGTWTKTGIGPNAKVYNVDAGNYQTKTIIPSTQGFIVEITNSTNQLTIPADARVHNGQNWYKNEETNENTLELKLSGGDNSFYDITQIIYTEGASLEFDDQFDGHKFYGVPSAPQMYTISPSMEKLTDNHIPDSPNEILVPLHIEVASDGDYTLDVEFNTINSQKNTYLEDLITGELINLATQDTYTFQASKDDAPNRFLLHFNSTTGIEESVNQESVHIYSYNHQIYIQSEEVLDGQVNIYDLSGKLIQTKTINDSGLESMSIHQAAGVYFVEFISKQKTYKEKVIIR